jgi:hypothetical protein
MTIGIAWVGRWHDREHLYIAADSRVTGGQRMDACPKILTLPRSDCAICFAGETANTFPLMLQMANAIAAHEPARDRALDVTRVMSHVLRVFTDLAERFKDLPSPIKKSEVQFIFAGYSWLTKSFRIWTVYYSERERRFAAREATSFHTLLPQAAFIGDHAKRIRGLVARFLNARQGKTPIYLEPLVILAEQLRVVTKDDTIGGPPQLVRVTQHLNTRPLCVRWNGEDTLFGRPLFAYENTDYLIVDPFSCKFLPSRKFGKRTDCPSGAADSADSVEG